ncbi:hypothetical protein PR048_026459 [Dryococelus australis]|uniref:Uncharacterized protein n=1 Tax=Dryococelus australis TaxID=614101 RepID=A0ABQ9GLG1_9NEOP|nr:hypothetical protein PR048_026459 [Dryococelus australis]
MRPLWVVLGGLCVALAHPAATARGDRALVVVSFDGFRPDYLGRGLTPVLDGLRAEGSRAAYMHNVFPTKTFPNHHSIATGLYPESHGVLGNSVYDVARDRRIGYGPQLYSNPGVTPIWTLNQMAGGGRHSGVMMWPGGEFSYNGVLPTFRQPYDLQVGWESRVDTVVGWLVHPSTPANLVMLYFEEPDRRAHAFGPDSPEVRYHIQKLDNITRYLRQKLAAHNLMDRVNVVQLSDHGMEAVTLARIINITDFVSTSQFKMIDTSPVIQLFPVKACNPSALVDVCRLTEVIRRRTQEWSSCGVLLWKKLEYFEKTHKPATFTTIFPHQNIRPWGYRQSN